MDSQSINEPTSRHRLLPFAISVLIAVLMVAILFGEGRILWCRLGDPGIYVNDAWNSSHTSQHLFDPYSFTHLLHGILFIWITAALFKRLSIQWRFAIAVFAESAWELIENSTYIIERYRSNTASLDYFGDSIANSVGDVIACAAGFWIAAGIGLWRSVFFLLAVETILLLWIKDSLLLNIIMLLYPFDFIKEWQMA